MAEQTSTGKAATPDGAMLRLGLWLVAGTMAYNLVEAVIALWAGAQAESIALFGFGLDSLIELAAAAALIHRLSVESRGASLETLEKTERGVHRFIGATFLALATYVLAQSAWTILAGQPPRESLVGIILATASLVVMPLVSWKKLQVASAIQSAALRSEALETLACSYLSFTLLLGLAANALLGWWWADPAAALLMVPWLIKEGREAFSGGCCAGGTCSAGQQPSP
ncbi:MAG: cation transporter [Deltaproteobacteria bacterium]|nr:cation transporter [Deltaproteobacteria bacterium]